MKNRIGKALKMDYDEQECFIAEERKSNMIYSPSDYITKDNDPVFHPSHYTDSDVEPIVAIEAWGLGFNLGNSVKYIARAGKKDPEKTLEDLKKSRWYLDREIANLEKIK